VWYCFSLDMLAEAGVVVRHGASVDKVGMDGPRITGITLTDGSSLAAKLFIDASYEGDLMARSGVAFAVGRESRAEFGEVAAGIHFDKTPRKARTVDAQGRLLPGISAWAKDLKEGDAHCAPMNCNFRLTVAKDPKLQVPVSALQEKLRAQKQVVDFLPGQPEKCTDLNGPPEF
jgi:hypothetical protein